MEQAIWTWISPVCKGKSFGPNLHDFGCKMLIFQPVFPKYYSQHLTLSASNVGSVGCKKTWENNLACKKEGTWKDVFFVNDDSTHRNWTCLPERGDSGISCFPITCQRFSVFPMFCHHNEGQPFTMGNVGVQVIRRRQSGEDRKFIYFPHALPAVKVSPRFLTER